MRKYQKDTILRSADDFSAAPVCADDDQRPERPVGFEDVSPTYTAVSRDAARLHESIRLQQAFAALESQSDRNQLLALAEQLSTRQS